MPRPSPVDVLEHQVAPDVRCYVTPAMVEVAAASLKEDVRLARLADRALFALMDVAKIVKEDIKEDKTQRGVLSEVIELGIVAHPDSFWAVIRARWEDTLRLIGEYETKTKPCDKSYRRSVKEKLKARGLF